MSDADFDFEHQPGIPAPLPPGERLLWQGKPHWQTLAIHAFHVRKVAIYFALILTVVLISGWSEGASRMTLVDDALTTLLLAALALAILGTLAWLSARVTIYTLTTRRILIRFGIALQITMNLPFTRIAAASVRVNRSGSGDIPLTLTDTANVNYLVLWPHVRPWRFAAPQPMLRSVPHVQRLAALIAGVVEQQQTEAMPATETPAAGIDPTRPVSTPADPVPARPVPGGIQPAQLEAG